VTEQIFPLYISGHLPIWYTGIIVYRHDLYRNADASVKLLCPALDNIQSLMCMSQCHVQVMVVNVWRHICSCPVSCLLLLLRGCGAFYVVPSQQLHLCWC